MSDYKLKKGCVLVLRTCAGDMTSFGGFPWPKSGPVEVPSKHDPSWGSKPDEWRDGWISDAKCGGGLHGWLWGQGDFSLKNSAADAVWLVVEISDKSFVDIAAKVKFPKGYVVFTSQCWWDAMAFVRRHRPKNKKVESFNTGYSGHAAATGDSGHAAATGYSGHAAATGNSGHAAATGDSGHAAATGYSGHAAATGNFGHAAATGNFGHAAATGYSGHAAATGDFGHAAATGNFGHAAATGDSGHAAATGDSGIACGLGTSATVKAGKNGVIIATFLDQIANRPRILVGYVGEDGIEADIEYMVRDGKFVPKSAKSP